MPDMNQEEIYAQIVQCHHEHRAETKRSLSALPTEQRRMMVAAIGIAGDNQEAVSDEMYQAMAELAHIGIMDILLEIESAEAKPAEPTAP